MNQCKYNTCLLAEGQTALLEWGAEEEQTPEDTDPSEEMGLMNNLPTANGNGCSI